MAPPPSSGLAGNEELGLGLLPLRARGRGLQLRLPVGDELCEVCDDAVYTAWT
jgi:hypothetical protein